MSDTVFLLYPSETKSTRNNSPCQHVLCKCRWWQVKLGWPNIQDAQKDSWFLYLLWGPPQCKLVKENIVSPPLTWNLCMGNLVLSWRDKTTFKLHGGSRSWARKDDAEKLKPLRTPWQRKAWTLWNQELRHLFFGEKKIPFESSSDAELNLCVLSHPERSSLSINYGMSLGKLKYLK